MKSSLMYYTDKDAFLNDIRGFLKGYLGYPVSVSLTVINSRNMESYLEWAMIDSYGVDNLHSMLKKAGGKYSLYLEVDKASADDPIETAAADVLSSAVEAFLESIGVSYSEFSKWDADACIVADKSKSKSRGFSKYDYGVLFPGFNEDFCTEVLGIEFPEDEDDDF